MAKSPASPDPAPDASATPGVSGTPGTTGTAGLAGSAAEPESGPPIADAPAPRPDGPRSWQDVVDVNKKTDVPEGLWLRCPECETMLFRKNVEANLHVCTKCEAHFRISADERATQLCDPGSFEPLWENVAPLDALAFSDVKPYKDRLKSEQRKTGHRDAMLCGKGFIKGRGVVLGCMDGRFMMGSMGCVVGEKLTRAVELATKASRPLVVVSCSGGARMQEGAMSLMMLAKVSAALARFAAAGGLYVSVLSDPTTGGVTASFAMLGDVILAEPRALICFAGPRVIANTVRQELPKGFQTSEFLLAKGFVDRVVHRRDLRSEISRIIDFAGK
ncbi:MAG: acetyl-CoA carboxylase, carboxyltransferase subunit beta [Planctomycetota bacterium]|nr:acetyl-CoA carboxylase, carboxyltransferase subunit beta [Planctomycetota bacterium]